MTDISRDLAGPRLAALNAASREALRVFAAAGFDVIEPGQLLDAENLLDLYGEDVRARTFVFPGADRELCLRPDLTLPICRHHLTGAAQGQARYAAAGSVFRKPNSATGRAAEFRQVGAEWYGAHDPAEAEAEVFRLTLEALAAIGIDAPEIVTGDLSIPFAMVDAAPIPTRARARLKRHVWRSDQFRAQLNALTEGGNPDAGRLALLKALGALEPAQARAAVERMLSLHETTHVGRRSPDEIAARFLEQAEDAQAIPLPKDIIEAIDAATMLCAPCDEALPRLRALAKDAALNIVETLDRFERRLDAFEALGIKASSLPFDGRFGRSLEYYDGFVFEFFDARLAQSDRRAAQLAGGGRYDRLIPEAARAFGAEPRQQNAIGAAIRPETALRAIGGEA